ncbi:MAG: deoxyribodipyrimidine photo-lyase [Hyphomicrobiaceae bacterium]|nr:deoxyribodipyrimidine photo-lyase [Hyphomicrobiaceae bacterium]MCC0023384.1 deoxyribodipyrimidine photo-lyase [Hyphomicrobiaceae bacterium]
MTQRSLVWFRQDLRISDNPALAAASHAGEILPVYILDDEGAGEWAVGAASRVWLHHALVDLDKSLGGGLQLFRGEAEHMLPEIVAEFGISEVHWNRCYEPWRVARDTRIKASLSRLGTNVHSHNASLLWEPWTIRKPDKTPYKVFTPFYKKGCLNGPAPRPPLPEPNHLKIIKDRASASTQLDDLGLLPKRDWHKTMMQSWQATEAGARDRLQTFLDTRLPDYAGGRDAPAKEATSRLSPYLHFGQISPRQIWHALETLEPDRNSERFRTELAWREFSYALLHDNPTLPEKNLQSRFDGFPWRSDYEADFEAWKRGMTGIPIVDAGMRELWQTGHMHNRVRMITASFLVKNLLIDWRLGEKWFWDTLVDADLANNSASWQWVAGSGADAAPYFRIFNPVLQAAKFDPKGEYIRAFVPELANLEPPHLFDPGTAPAKVLEKASIVLGSTYPRAIVDLKQSRERALEGYAGMRGNGHAKTEL